MHIPDGFLDPITASITYLITITVLAISIYKVRGRLEERYAPIIGILAATIFVAQMLDWPIPGGTTAHFVGSALAVIIVGLYAGILIMSIVLFMQAVIFQDGGLTTLGANFLTMGIVGCVVGYLVFMLIMKKLNIKRKIFFAAFFAGWLSITLAAFTCGLEIGFSTQFEYGVSVAVPAMTIWHAILGLLEGFITGVVVEYIYSLRPDIVLSVKGEG